jgi:YidC/Oxa1 family membrane protein insertase
LAEFQNPNQEPGMERRLLIVFALTFLVIAISQPLLKKYFPQSVTPPRTELPAKAPQQVVAPESSAAAQMAATTAVSVAGKQASAEAELVVENDFYRISFTNRGGQVKSWVLKKFDDDRGQPLDLVNGAAAAKYGYPLSLWTYDEGMRNKLNSALYVSSQSGNLKTPAEVTFEYADQDINVRKRFRFDQSYVVQVETSATQKGNSISALPVWPAGIGDQASQASYHSSQIEHQFNGDIERLAIKKISSGNTMLGPFNWAGVSDQYFTAVFLPEDPSTTSLITLRNALDVPKDWKKPNPQERVTVDVLGAAVGNLKGPTIERMYVGPKSLSVLESTPVPTINNAQPDLRGVVNFGFFGIIARPLFLWLKWTHEHIIANWGWAIVLQTLIINLALLPLRITSMKSMLKMQRIQPQIKSIQEKYKKYTMRDPRKQEMNKEIMDLQRNAGVSPIGGCLPMVIQLPFLFAYYAMLGSVLDLRHANWLWVRDLSSPDPLYLLPISIVISMLFMQRMTPQAGMDPAQQKMMTFMMPLMMGFMSFSLPAGLGLYWVEGQLIGIAQQWTMNRTSLGREMRELAAKRARKREK